MRYQYDSFGNWTYMEDCIRHTDWRSELLDTLVDFYDTDKKVHSVWDKYKDVEYVKELLKAKADELDLQVTPEFDEFISQFKRE